VIGQFIELSLAEALHSAGATTAMRQHESGAFDVPVPDERFGQGAIPPLRGTLEDFAFRAGCVNGVALDSLEPGTVVELDTRHSRYRMVVCGGDRRVLVAGGSRFPEQTEARIEGATAGGSVLKVGWIGVGLRLEMAVGRRRLTTSRVERIAVTGPPPPF
jgi:hypothetical protein